MKISIIRGAFLNPFECQLYAPLAPKHDINLIGSNWQLYPHPITYPGVQMSKASLWGAQLSRIHPKAPLIANRMLSWTTGSSFGFYDLDRCSSGADILHSAETFFTMTHQAVALKRTRGCGLVITVSENLLHMGERHPCRRRHKKDAIKAADAIIALTETTRAMLIKEGVSSDRITVIPWSLDLKRFHPSPKNPALLAKLNINADNFVVLFIGRFIPEKGIEDILRCASEIASQGKDQNISFLFVGQGPLEIKIRQTQRRYPDLIRLHSFAPYEELPALHNLADVLILPSREGHHIAEQFGFVLIESMACAKPVITTSVGSIHDVVGDAALLIKPGRPEELFVQIQRLRKSEQLRRDLSSKALSRAKNHFDAQINAARVEAVYADVGKRVR